MNVDWNTPARFVESARRVMGSIDLDPATNGLAQETVRAKQFYTAEGELQPWVGNVFCNPPYDSRINLFAAKLLASEGVQQAVFMSNSKTDTRWWQMLAKQASASASWRDESSQTARRNSPTCGHTFMYFGENKNQFVSEFGQYGLVVIRDLSTQE